MLKSAKATKTKKGKKEKKPAAKKPSAKKKTAKKKTAKKVIEKKVSKAKAKPLAQSPLEAEKYYEAVGRRKTSISRARLFTKGEKVFLVNKKPLDKYFPSPDLQKTATVPLEIMKCLDKFRVLVNVRGGGLNSQAEATRHAIARALVIFNSGFRKRLKKAGFLKRDPRMKERKKFGLKRARKAPQWSKR